MIVNREEIYQGIILTAGAGGTVDYKPFRFGDKGLFDYLIELGTFNGFPVVGNTWLEKPMNLAGVEAIAAELSIEYKFRNKERQI